ncbi:hypothetical protein NDU88_001527 [Pleurodeles waltl]|uniref:Uncharacterized protein n=1 Tax=Pleurodeles waltl TaxID=8319 RepID=A0AAV7S7M1_PLEWA|nr:hypothetical protein NDU88_001527 [Pleurodeles waltl]
MDSSRSRSRLPWCFALSTAPPAGHSRGRRGEHRCRRSPVSDAWRLNGSSKCCFRGVLAERRYNDYRVPDRKSVDPVMQVRALASG